MVEVWANEERWRYIRTHSYNSKYHIQYSWGKFDKPVSYFVKMFQGNVKSAMEASIGAGAEKWYENLTKEKALERINSIRKNATKNGFTMIGRY